MAKEFTGKEPWETRFLLWTAAKRIWHVVIMVDFNVRGTTACGHNLEFCFKLGPNTHFYLNNINREPICKACRATLMDAGKDGPIELTPKGGA